MSEHLCVFHISLSMQILNMPPTQQCEGEVNTQYMQRGEVTVESNQQNKEKNLNY